MSIVLKIILLFKVKFGEELNFFSFWLTNGHRANQLQSWG